MVKAEDQIYGYAMKLVDDAILSLRDEIEKGTLTPDRHNFLAYLLSREALSIKDVTVISLSALLDGLSTTTPSGIYYECKNGSVDMTRIITSLFTKNYKKIVLLFSSSVLLILLGHRSKNSRKSLPRNCQCYGL